MTQPDSVAVLRFTVARLYLLQHIIGFRPDGRWKVPDNQIPELNKHLTGAIVIVARYSQSTQTVEVHRER